MKIPALLIALLALLPLVAQAASLAFLKHSLLEQLTDNDISLLKKEIGTVLNKSPDMKIIRWQSPDSGIAVLILPKLSFHEGTRECRRTLFKFTKGDRKPEHYRFDICKDEKTGWQVSDSLIRRITDEDWRLLEATVAEVLASDEGNKVPASWFNPASKNSGVVVPIASVKRDEKTCRELAISIINPTGGSMDGHYTFCKTATTWERQM
jgi:surface antigen